VLVGGTWKIGKTDMILYISEWLRKLKSYHTSSMTNKDGTPYDMPLVSEVASNIDTFGTYPLITDLVSLRQWIYGSKSRKLYIFDEASEHLPNTRGMTSKSVGFKQLIPEISKAHARMAIVGHALLKVDSTLLDETWCKGIFIKKDLKTVEVISHLLPHQYTFRDLERTNIPFDPDLLAPFTEKPAGSLVFKEEDKQKLWNWVNGMSPETLGMHRMQLNRLVRKYMKIFLERDGNMSHT
jgi:hypothetical protein